MGSSRSGRSPWPGVPLARIVELAVAPDAVFQDALAQIDDDLTARIRVLRQTQQRLQDLAAGRVRLLPAEVEEHLQQLGDLGLSTRWVTMVGDLWILMFATHPDLALELFRDQAQQLTDPVLRRMYIDYDHAHDLDPRDPSIDELAHRIVHATAQRYGGGPTADLPGQTTGSQVPQLVQGAINDSSPAWRRLDNLIRDGVNALSDPGRTP